MSGPLDTLSSLKVKLGSLVAASVVVATVLAAIGAAAGVPALLTVPVAVALALAVTQLLAAGMVAPLRQMTDAAQRMARGDYSGRVSTTTTDEVGRLAVAFNRMADDLARVDTERRGLIATVSHELRTPLAAMTAVLENLADGVVPADPAHLAEALDQAERLHGLVTDLLDLSRLEAGVTPLEPRPTELAPLVAACVEIVVSSGRTGKYDVSVPTGLTVDVDPARLRQLLINVLDNAGRHSPDGVAVRVSAGTGDSSWWLEVADGGPGVPPADRERVFERFGSDTAGGGTGLGLAVARWVARLHGGTLRFLDPTAGTTGARLRLDLPARLPSGRPAPTPAQEPAMTTTTTAPRPAPGAVSGAPSALDGLFGRFWPDRPGSSGSGIVAASALVGLLAAAIMTFSLPGLSWMVVLLAAGITAFVAARHRRNRFTLASAALSGLLVLPVALLDNLAIATLCVLGAAAVFLVGVTGARTLGGFVLTGLAWPLASLRGLPWFGRSLRLVGTLGRTPAVVRTAAWSLLGLAVFGALFASADALFATWVDALVPNLSFNDLVARGFVGVAVFGLTLAAAYLAHNPARVDPERARPEPLRNRFEWLAPVLLVDAVFVMFLIAQVVAVFGGHEYLEETTGLTYAENVHQGFGQLTVATALTILVVWAGARRAGHSPADRLWLRGSLGLLCVLTLVVVASALYRMHIYQEAYGFTTLRLTVDVFEGWLGVVVVALMITGAVGLGRWLPRIALLTGGVALIGLAAVNPDAWVADRNIDRYQTTGRLDVRYLQSLSADAAPVIAERLPAAVARCALQYLPVNQLDAERDGVLAWNLGRERARTAIAPLDPPRPGATPGADPCAPVYAELDEPTGVASR
jgi:signal transduction histidine kinase